jgi:hypothetical protein
MGKVYYCFYWLLGYLRLFLIGKWDSFRLPMNGCCEWLHFSLMDWLRECLSVNGFDLLGLLTFFSDLLLEIISCL